MKYKGLTINLRQEEDCDCDPREWDNLGTMFCWHKRYTLGDKDAINPNEIKDKLAVCLPLYLYQHSGMTITADPMRYMRYPFTDSWDAGQVGWIYVTRDTVRKEYGWKRITKERREKLTRHLISEVEIYDQYLTGDVWWYEIEDENGEFLDSLGGLFGYEYAEQEAKNAADYVFTEQMELFRQDWGEHTEWTIEELKEQILVESRMSTYTERRMS